MRNNFIFVLLLLFWFLLLPANFVVAKQNYTSEMQKAVPHQVSLTFAARCTQLTYLMRKVVLRN